MILNLHLEMRVRDCRLNGHIPGGGRACERREQGKSESTTEGPACCSEPGTGGSRETQVRKLAEAEGLGLVHQGGRASSSRKGVFSMTPVSDVDYTHRKTLSLSLLLKVWTKKSKTPVWLWQSEKILIVIGHVD